MQSTPGSTGNFLESNKKTLGKKKTPELGECGRTASLEVNLLINREPYDEFDPKTRAFSDEISWGQGSRIPEMTESNLSRLDSEIQKANLKDLPEHSSAPRLQLLNFGTSTHSVESTPNDDDPNFMSTRHALGHADSEYTNTHQNTHRNSQRISRSKKYMPKTPGANAYPSFGDTEPGGKDHIKSTFENLDRPLTRALFNVPTELFRRLSLKMPLTHVHSLKHLLQKTLTHGPALNYVNFLRSFIQNFPSWEKFSLKNTISSFSPKKHLTLPKSIDTALN